MKIIIKASVYVLVLIILTCIKAVADDKEAKKPTGFNTGIYCSITGKINVFVDRISQKKPAYLILYSESGHVLYHETVGSGTKKFGRSLNVDQLEPGTYTVSVVINGEKVQKSFVLSEKKVERTLAFK